MKRVLSFISMQSEAGDDDHTEGDTASTSSSQQRVKKPRKAKVTQSNTAPVVNISPQVAVSQSQSGGLVVINNDSINNNTIDATVCEETVGISLETLSNQLNVNTSGIQGLSRRFDDILLYLKEIGQFLGLEITSTLHNVTLPVTEPSHLPSNQNDEAPVQLPSASISAISARDTDNQMESGIIDVPTDMAGPTTTRPVKNAWNRSSRDKGCTLKDVVLNAIYKDNAEREKRDKSIIVSGLEVVADKTDHESVRDLLNNEFEFDPGEFKCFRLGQKHPGYSQPLLVALASKNDAAWLVANSSQLRQSRNIRIRENVFISRNLSREERCLAYEMRCKRRAQRGRQLIANNVSGANVAGATVRESIQPNDITHCADGAGGSGPELGRPIRVITNSSHGYRRGSDPHYVLDDLYDFPRIGRATHVDQPVIRAASSELNSTAECDIVSVKSSGAAGPSFTGDTYNATSPATSMIASLGSLTTTTTAAGTVRQSVGDTGADKPSGAVGPSRAEYTSHATLPPACLNAPPVYSSISSIAGGTVPSSTGGRLC